MEIDLEAIPFRATRYPGVAIHFCYKSESSDEAAVLIKMDPGCSYPAHRHRGSEQLLILQGGYRDERGEHRAGDFVRYEDGTIHHPVALEDTGCSCVFFAISAEGISLLDREQSP